MTREQILIQALRDGNEAALGKIYDLYAKDLLAYCYAYVKSKEDSEEIVQDTFVKLWKIRSTIIREDTLRPFIFTIAHRKIIDLLRQRVRSIAFEDFMTLRSSIVEGDSDIDFDQYVRQVKSSIRQLTPTQQKIVWMSDFEGMNNDAIAGKLNISEKTVRNQLSLGNKKLHALIKDFLKIFLFLINL